ncbi:MAG: amidophosphoribosyltransferase [Pyramidobacter sp.]|nr:amidophosphoribosyltransferase [Pyramidobacter sp.]
MCGIIGAYSPRSTKLPEDIFLGLYALQNRGQEAAGIAWTNGHGEIDCRKGSGLVHSALDQAEICQIECCTAIGHVRYPTAGGSGLNNTQPMLANSLSRGSFAVVHNGNMTNAEALRTTLEGRGALFQSSSDTEVLLHLISHQPNRPFLDALSNALRRLRGAYSFIILHDDKLIAARDPWGFRPLALGKRGDIMYVASESCAFDLLGAQFIRDVQPGEIIVIDENGCQSFRIPHETKRKYHCVFEYVYFARPDSIIDGVSVYESRKRMGRELAKACAECEQCRKALEHGLVTGLPDSGTIAALGFAEESGVQYESAIVRNRYSGRTFIEPTQRVRELGVLKKLNPMKELIKDRDILVIDDSIVRGTTSIKVAQLLRDKCGAKSVNMCISSPPVTFPCYYGIDTPSRRELVAARLSGEDLRKHLSVDTLSYLSREALIRAVGLPEDQLCTACFDGNYMEEEDHEQFDL